MEINNIQVCNVCLRSSEESAGAVFIKAMKNGEEIHVCTGCISSYHSWKWRCGKVKRTS